MIRPEPETLEALLAELLVERFGPTGGIRRERAATPAEIQTRQRVLNEAMAEPVKPVRLATVVPLRREDRAA